VFDTADCKFTMTKAATVSDAEVLAGVRPEREPILTPEALAFIAALQRELNPHRKELLAQRQERKQRLDAGELPDFLPDTREIRESDWTVAPIPSDLVDRRVEITGPVDRKMIINALNCGANVCMADFEDANSPTWARREIGLRQTFRAAETANLRSEFRRHVSGRSRGVFLPPLPTRSPIARCRTRRALRPSSSSNVRGVGWCRTRTCRRRRGARGRR
jgi:malate synthase